MPQAASPRCALIAPAVTPSLILAFISASSDAQSTPGRQRPRLLPQRQRRLPERGDLPAALPAEPDVEGDRNPPGQRQLASGMKRKDCRFRVLLHFNRPSQNLRNLIRA